MLRLHLDIIHFNEPTRTLKIGSSQNNSGFNSFVISNLIIYLYLVLRPSTTSASELLSPFRLGGRAAGGGGGGYLEKDSQLPGHQVEAVLLEDVWISQD